MKLTLIGPGIIPIPPTGWGAVEILIWDYKYFLEKYFDVEVQIINTQDRSQIYQQISQFNPDIIHIHFDWLYDLTHHLDCQKILITSHNGYLDQYPNHPEIYPIVINEHVNASRRGATIICLSPLIRDVYLRAGANVDIFHYEPTPHYPHRSIYLGKIDRRKRQYLYQDLSLIDFVGNSEVNESLFQIHRRNYLGEWKKEHLYQHLTDYANLVLLSEAEAHALVCCEALICGLGLVVSESASANLDRTLPFIQVIPTEKLNDLNYIEGMVQKNQKISVQMREEIHQYGLTHFSWRVILQQYVECIQKKNLLKTIENFS
jgi:hypothetical protein